jgi:hypothetical protein
MGAGMETDEDCMDWLPRSPYPIKRTQRHPQYSDHELIPFFKYISLGYCYKQAADKCLYPRKWVINTLYSDDETMGHILDLSMKAGELIRERQQPAPQDRYDGLWDEYLP